MQGIKSLFGADDFTIGLNALDNEIGKDIWLSPYTPITLLSAGGFLAVTLLRNRQATGDLHYLLEPQWAYDNDVKKPLHEAIKKAGRHVGFEDNWANEDMAFFVPKRNREYLFKEALEQNIVLWEGDHFQVLAVPLEWALERKLRRVHHRMQNDKRYSDVDDALALLRYLKEKKGSPLDQNYIRTLNMCSTEAPPDQQTMGDIAAAYQKKYKEEIFD